MNHFDSLREIDSDRTFLKSLFMKLAIRFSYSPNLIDPQILFAVKQSKRWLIIGFFSSRYPPTLLRQWGKLQVEKGRFWEKLQVKNGRFWEKLQVENGHK